MVILDRLQEQLPETAGLPVMCKAPAVEQWNPPFTGDIDICIKANGDWFHEGVRFARPALVQLFSGLLKKEGNEYFLVTPVEKWRIQVEDVPLFVIDFVASAQGCEKQCIHLTTSSGDEFPLDAQHPLHIAQSSKPYVKVRNNLQALLSRNVYYALVEMAVTVNGQTGVWSCGEFFPLG